MSKTRGQGRPHNEDYATQPNGSAGGVSSKVGMPPLRRESFSDVSRALTAFMHSRGMQVGYARMNYGAQSPEFKNTEETEA